MREDRSADADDRPAPMGLAMSFVPYVVLSVDAGWFFDEGVQSVLVTDMRVDTAKFKIKKP